jgi:hypothetical protein
MFGGRRFRRYGVGKWERRQMKLLAEYLERAVGLERLAADEPDSTFKNQLLTQAAAYRKLAAKRAAEYGLPPPGSPEIPD